MIRQPPRYTSSDRLVPYTTLVRSERRGQRDIEAAVAVQQGRRAAVERQVLRMHDEVRPAGAVLAGGEVLLDPVVRCVEVHRHRLQRFRLDLARLLRQHPRSWRDVVAGGDPQSFSSAELRVGNKCVSLCLHWWMQYFFTQTK